MQDRPLWAPWRVEYVTQPKGDECIFCAAAGGHDPHARLVVDRGAHAFTMLNAFPYAAGHLMVSPVRHVGGIDELGEEEAVALMRLTKRCVGALGRMMSPDGFNIGLNIGRAAGAGFAGHLHVHVVPRFDGDNNFMPVLAGERVISQALDATAAALRDLLGETG